MFVYRIASSQFINDLSGEGARRFGGRWNQPGISVLYTAGSISLAVLSSSILLKPINEDNKKQFSLATIEIPDDSIEELELDIYSYRFLSNEDYRFDTVKKWIEKKEKLCLKVPSEIVPGEYNILINTNHPLAQSDVKLVEVRPFVFDSTILRPLIH